MNRSFGVAFAALAAMLVAHEATACSIVYGKDWAFLSDTPSGWHSACGDKALDETVVTLWPANESTSALDTVIYVTVSIKDPKGLQDFVSNDEAMFRKASSSVLIKQDASGQTSSKSPYYLVSFENTASGRQEYVAYVDGPNADYKVVLTCNTLVLRAKYKQAFIGYVQNFVPMVHK